MLKFGNRGLLEQNGFARKKIWVIDDNPPPLHRNESSGRAYTDLLLKPSEEDLKIWPHRYDLLLIQYPYIVHMHHKINKIIKLSSIRNIMIWFISTWIVDEEVIKWQVLPINIMLEMIKGLQVVLTVNCWPIYFQFCISSQGVFSSSRKSDLRITHEEYQQQPI